ncbi:DUF2190 family protein [Nitratireductor sp. StC3]|uniref:structural cement protein Gp24 n=1 Tax=Nitratireductor sp. StC3 TaxID=2126741 RepID=UPI000D0D1288|nr:DUF2190 family protein [Nitratireductor sp. StC3]PSM18229.1 hypothetical protein C7T96_10180 [Nitratireductor sp. StC3]
MIANAETANVITRIAGGAIAFGQPCVRTGDRTCAIADEAYTAAGSESPGNAANTGTITDAPTVSGGVKAGRYTITMLDPATNAGQFVVEDPDGVSIGFGTVAVEFTGGGLTFTISDGSQDFVAGEQLYVDVSADVGSEVLGISVRDPSLDVSNNDAFAQYDSVPIMTMGVIWVTAGATVVAGDLVYWDDADSRYTDLATDFPVIVNGTHARFETGGADGDLVKIAIR